MKICTGVDLGDVIIDVKFKVEKYQGFRCHGSKFAVSHRLCTWALPQCSATALTVIGTRNNWAQDYVIECDSQPNPGHVALGDFHDVK